jgi:hypothetical protein
VVLKPQQDQPTFVNQFREICGIAIGQKIYLRAILTALEDF